MIGRSRSRVLQWLATTAALFGLTTSSAYSQTYYRDQEVQVHDLPSLKARTNDPSDVILTSLDTVFHDKEVCCGRDSALVDSAQAADPKSLKDVAAKLAGRHLLSDGRPIKIAAEYLAPDAVSAGHLVTMIANQHAPLMQWKSHLYVVHGVVLTWVEDASTGATAVVIRRFLLWDVRFADSRRSVVFDRETKDISKVQGLLFFEAQMD